MTKQTKRDFDTDKLESFKTTSAKIRYLNALDFTRGEISKILNIRYQWVRNVLVTPVKDYREKV